jgi:hypothetical protein
MDQNNFKIKGKMRNTMGFAGTLTFNLILNALICRKAGCRNACDR